MCSTTQYVIAPNDSPLNSSVDTVLEVVLWDKENPRVAININVWLVEQNVAAFKQEDDDLSGC